jgi:hypothetical protein
MAFRQPVCYLRCQPENPLTVLAGVKLGKHGSSAPGFEGIVAQDMALAGAIADRRNPIASGRGLTRKSAARCFGTLKQALYVFWHAETHELTETGVERRNLNMHAPSRGVGYKPQERRRDPSAQCLGLHIG